MSELKFAKYTNLILKKKQILGREICLVFFCALARFPDETTQKKGVRDMENRRLVTYRRCLLVLLVVCGVAIAYIYKFYVVETVPDTILLRKGQEEKISFDIFKTSKIRVIPNSGKKICNHHK